MAFWQILLSYFKFLMPRPFKWGILGAGTIILSGDIHNHILCMFRFFMNQSLIVYNFVLVHNKSNEQNVTKSKSRVGHFKKLFHYTLTLTLIKE